MTDYVCSCKKKCKSYLRGHALSLSISLNKRNKINISNKHNLVKNPNWQEADQLAIYKV